MKAPDQTHMTNKLVWAWQVARFIWPMPKPHPKWEPSTVQINEMIACTLLLIYILISRIGGSKNIALKHFHLMNLPDPPFIESALLLSRATVQIFPGKKCRLCFSPFHSGTVFTRVPLLVYHYLWTKWLILFPTIVKMTNNIISDRGSQNLMLKDFIWCLGFHISDE